MNFSSHNFNNSVEENSNSNNNVPRMEVMEE